jgi:uncharacterized membrane protein YjgN (DUF898 family)
MGVFDTSPQRGPALPHDDPAQGALDVSEQTPDTSFDEPSDFHLSGHWIPLVFTGHTGEYFRIWIVCQLLTLMSLGLYAPWARLRKQQYLAQHWQLNGRRFYIEFNPAAKLKGRLLVYGILITALILALLYPYAQPAIIALAFIPAPWLLSQSNRFNWQTLSFNAEHGVLRFSSWGSAKTLKKPLWLLGLALALMSVSFSFYGQYLQDWHLLVYVCIWVVVFFLLFPMATSHLLYQKFAHAKLGKTRFTLVTNPHEINMHMIDAVISSGMFAIYLILTTVQIVTLFMIKQPDLRALLTGLNYVMMTAAVMSFASARRLNFVLNRLHVAGLQFRSSLPPFGQAWRSSAYAALGVVTLGLSIPWSTVKYSRWRAAQLQVNLEGNWMQFVSGNQAVRGGALDELAEQFDLDLGL